MKHPCSGSKIGLGDRVLAEKLMLVPPTLQRKSLIGCWSPSQASPSLAAEELPSIRVTHPWLLRSSPVRVAPPWLLRSPPVRVVHPLLLRSSPVRVTHYSRLTCCFTVAWPQAKQNEGPCSALGSCPTPDCAFQQTERGFEVCLPPAHPKQGVTQINWLWVQPRDAEQGPDLVLS